MDKLRIGIFSEPFFHDQAGGGFSYYESLAKAIDEYQFDEALDVRFISIGAGENSYVKNKILKIEPAFYKEESGTERKVNKHRIITKFKSFVQSVASADKRLGHDVEIANVKAIEQQLIKHRIDLIYYLFPQVHRFNYPFVSTHWDVGHRSTFCFPEVALNNNFPERQEYYKTTINKAFAVYCESEAGKAELIRYTAINEERVFIVPIFPGEVINKKVSTPDQQQHLRNHDLLPKAYFFYPAQLWSHKNHYNLLVAFKKLQSLYPDIKLVFTGADKGNGNYIRQVITDLELQSKVVLTGFVSVETVHSLYKNALALIMPTFLGPTNMPLLEAEALGCPVICSDLQGHREMMAERAVYIQPHDPNSIYKAMATQIRQPATKIPYHHPVFNIENAVKQMEANFLAILPIRKAFGFDVKQA